jgi:ethanolamine utilization microcompartment shell protein EutL
MSFPTAVNDQITDAVTQSNVKVLADSPANALSNLYQANAHAVSLSIQNANFGQQQTTMIHQATTTQGVNLIYAVDTEAVADTSEKISHGDVLGHGMVNLLIHALMSKKPDYDNLPPHLKAAYEQFAKQPS